MKTIYYTASSIDGFIADESNSLEWLFQFGEIPTDYDDFVKGVGAAAMGAGTWRWLWERHFQENAPQPIPWPYDFPVWVFSHGSGQMLAGADLRWVHGDVRSVHADMTLAARGRNLWIIGGGNLAGQFAQAGLLDELWITYAPVTLGSGRPVLAASGQRLGLLEIRTFGDVFVQMRLTTRVDVPGSSRSTQHVPSC